MGGRGFAVGDRVVGTRNDRHAGILNGQRGTVRATDTKQRSLDLELDGGANVRLGEDYLAAGHLDHGYAITAHRAQGSTVDETFVLGSEELYREWGYTALSRHRARARFYVARGDLRPDPELPPPPDALVAGISRLLERSHAKELALDALPQAEREQLQIERRELRDRLEGQPPPRRLPHLEEQDLQAAASALENARHREQLLRDQREALRWWHRGARAEVDARLADNLQEQQRDEKRLGDAVDAAAVADRTDHHWISTHGPHASRFVAIDRELGARDQAERHAVRRLDDLKRDPLQAGRPTRELALDRDSLDLGM